MTTQPLEESATESAPLTPRRRGLWWLSRLLIVMVLVACVLGGLLWWHEWKLSQANAALRRGDTKHALYLVGKILASNPADTRALAIQARGLVNLGQADAAIEIFDHIGAASPEDMHALAQAYMFREDWTSGLRLLKPILQRTPNDSDALYEIASCQLRLGEYEEALEHARRFATKPGQAARGYLMIGSIYGSMRNDREAAKAFERVLQDEPNGENLQVSRAEFFLRYGRVLMGLGKPREALEPLKQSVASQDTGEAFALLGDAASQLGEPKNAVAAWKKAVEVEPNNFSARASLANAALLAGDGKQALQWLEPMSKSENQSSSLAYLFQRTFALLENEKEAALWREKAAALRRDEDVLSAIESVLITDPNSFWARAARAHRFASEGNWAQADLLVSGLVAEQPGEPFIIELADAIRRKGKLPAVTRIPVVRF